MGFECNRDQLFIFISVRIQCPLSLVHSTTLALRPASVLDADEDAHTSVSKDASAVPFTQYCV